MAIFIGWVIFSFEDMGAGFRYLQVLFGLSGAGVFDTESLYLLTNYGILLLILILGSTPVLSRMVGKGIKRCPAWLSAVLENGFYLLVFLLCVAYLVDATYNPFLYFRF